MNKDYTIDLDKITPNTWVYCDTEEKSEALVAQLGWDDGDTLTYLDAPVHYHIDESKNIKGFDRRIEEGETCINFTDVLAGNSCNTSSRDDMSVYEYATLAGRFCSTKECEDCPLFEAMCPEEMTPSMEKLQKAVQALREFQNPPKKPENFTLYRAYDSSGNFIKHGLDQEKLFAEGASYVTTNTAYGWREHVTD